MQKGEDRNFFRFATALTILVGSSISIQSTDPPQGLEKAEKLLRIIYWGPEEMKPDHHWAVHIPDRVPDYGPFIRNNWTGGLLKVSMMREFHRTAQLDEVNKDALGTIEDAAAHERESTRVLAGSIAARAERIQDDGMRLGLVNYYNWNGHKRQMLGSFAETYNYVLLNGCRLTPTTRSKRSSAGSSMIQFQFNGEPYAGEIRVIFRHKQTGVTSSEDTLLAFVAWMKPSTETPLDDDEFIWYEFPELSVDTWLYNTYAQAKDSDCPPCVLPLANVQCQVARSKIGYKDPPLSRVRFWLMEWATAPKRKNKLCC
ncbi:hypothetical protein B0H17DRAFT_1082740 [Mycena rosella]|uniref:Uncharacterized protein n=1 Tax=Mycena rosella TaxID=1033263 RepID=A0AAD7D1K2_MYCRO|nr:hypothetical protein B0H17DRAFT_1082740 [Mycena rosella]